MSQFILGIDIGLTFLKSVIYDVNGNIISEARKKTPVIITAEDCSEINMKKLWSFVKASVKESIFNSKISAGKIIGIGVSGHGNGVYFKVNENKYEIRKQLPFNYKLFAFTGFGNSIMSNTVFWKSKIMDETGFFDENLVYNMDGEFFARLFWN